MCRQKKIDASLYSACLLKTPSNKFYKRNTSHNVTKQYVIIPRNFGNNYVIILRIIINTCLIRLFRINYL